MTRSIVRHDIRTRSGVHRITQQVDLDEVVIPGRVHLEDMTVYSFSPVSTVKPRAGG